MKAYKLTDQLLQTYGGTQWVLNEAKTTSGEGNLCGPGWLHFYDDPYLAVVLNPIHADIKHPRLFEADATGAIKEDHGLKFGCTNLVLLKELPLPEVSSKVKIDFAIYCALEIYKDDTKFVTWARRWLSGEDRSLVSARAVSNSALRYTPHYIAHAVSYELDTTHAVADAIFAAAFSRSANINLKTMIKKALKNNISHL